MIRRPGPVGSSGSVVVIDAFPGSALRFGGDWAVVAVDVIRATTTAVTAVATGRPCYPVPTVRAALLRARQLDDPLLAGEVAGTTPGEFEMTNSPAGIAARDDVHRPVVLLSSSGTALIHNGARRGPCYVACFRNAAATVAHLAPRYARVAVVGAGSRGEFREEDQVCCTRIAEALVADGYNPGDRRTEEFLGRWTGAAPDAWLESRSVAWLRATGQQEDLDFVLAHRDDLDRAFRMRRGELVAEGSAAGSAADREGDGASAAVGS